MENRIKLMLEELFNDVKRSFPDVDARLASKKMTSFMLSDPYSKNIFYDPEQVSKYKFSDKALRGILAHELSHKVSYKRMNIIDRIFVMRRYKNDFDFKKKVEREADTIAVERGFGKELKQAAIETDLKFDKERLKRRKDTRLSLKEIDMLMRR